MASSEQAGENLEVEHTWVLVAWNRRYMLGRQLSLEYLLFMRHEISKRETGEMLITSPREFAWR